MLKSYVKKILEVARQGDAREESFYSILKELLLEYAASSGRKNIHVTVLPKKTEAGNPDFRVWDGKQKIVGYVEAKTPDRNLDDIERTEQVKRYKTTFPNFILTNFFEFRFYRGSSLVDKVRIADPMAIHNLKGTPFVENEEQFENLFEKFFSFSFPSITSAQPLAVELAKRTRFLRDEVIAEELREEEKNGLGKILGFYEAFQTYLIRGLTKEQFADLYSQTITYGLFASRMRCKGKFNRKHAVDDIPRSIGILREMFEYISLGDLPHQLEWIVDEIASVLANVNVKKIFSEYYRKKKGEDPVFHFYETFLAEYDPKERERRGVYYTPKPVVSYIVRSLHSILRSKFGLQDGLANENVTILDPAAGTLTFIAEAIKQATDEFVLRYGTGGKEDFFKEHIMRNFYAFELMIAPYAIGHLKISFLLDEMGYSLRDEEMRFYLTNTLELEDLEQTALPGMASLAEESRKAGEVKKKISILAILGNPPYSISSANKSAFIENEMMLYKEDVRDERNIQPLSDDYIKFIRFAHWKIGKNGKGIIGYISNNAYLSGIIHRGMRKKLLDSFDEIYFLNLHGSSRTGEKRPSGGKDENVFDIQQGVAIALYVKFERPLEKENIYYADLWGTRDEKYKYLSKNNINTTSWQKLDPKEPFYFFVPKDFALQGKYAKFWKITEIFKEWSSGIKTHRDNFVVGFTKREILGRLKTFASNLPDEEVKQVLLLKDTGTWKLKEARQKIKLREPEKEIYRYAYRPFDIRWICYNSDLIDRDRLKLMKHLLKDNLGLVFPRIVRTKFTHGFVVDTITDVKLGGRISGSETTVAPLYIYSLSKEKSVGEWHNANFREKFLKAIKKALKTEPKFEETFFYIYAILYSIRYRESFEEFLKIDFPSIPFTSDYDLFIRMGRLGKRLADLHLMKSDEIEVPIAKFQGTGDNAVEKPLYDQENERIYINKTQYFERIKSDIWKYRIGDYQILLRWLKYRKGRKLTLAEIKHYCEVVTVLKRTIEIQEEIDKLYPDVEENLIEFKESNKSLRDYTQ